MARPSVRPAPGGLGQGTRGLGSERRRAKGVGACVRSCIRSSARPASSAWSSARRPRPPRRGPGVRRGLGVNPTDWKARRGSGGKRLFRLVPNQDGAGVIEAVGDGSTRAASASGCGCGRLPGSAADGRPRNRWCCRRARCPPSGRQSFDIGASLGIPALTARRCLTVSERGARPPRARRARGGERPRRRGCRRVGHAAIQLARWSGAAVTATVSSGAKGELALAAAHTRS